MNYIGTQNFETKRCFLRRIKLSDYTMMYENWAKYDEVSRYYPFNPVDDVGEIIDLGVNPEIEL